jgi:periplasmic copper chaperone A
VMRVPHGCQGSPTLKVRVQIPEGVIAIKPMPKAGWQVETVKGKYAKTYDYFGTPMVEGVQEVVWTGKLLDEHYEEFVFRSWLTDSLKPDTTLYFRTVQECEDGKAERWIEIPAEGKTRGDYKYPAPGVKLTPAKATH